MAGVENRNMRTRIALLILIAVVSEWASQAQSPPQKRIDPAQTVIAHAKGFRVNLTLSDKAKKLLTEKRETIIVAAYVSGIPKPGTPSRFVEDMGEIGLGQRDVEVAPGQNADVGEIRLDSDALAQITDKGPQLLVNVFSGRKSSKNNLLSCDIYEGPLERVEGKSIAISCTLIAEVYPSVHVPQ